MIYRIFNIADKDAIREEEEKHEKYLKKQLAEYGINYKANDIRHFGIRKRKIKK